MPPSGPLPRAGGAEAEDDTGGFRQVDCLFGKTMRVSRHGGDVMRQQGEHVAIQLQPS